MAVELVAISCRHRLVQYSFMTAMAMEKMGIMATGRGVHTVTATAMEKN